MIISKTNQYILLKNKKVGSSSLEIYLSEYLNPMIDVWHGERGYKGERNFAAINQMGKNRDPHISWSEVQSVYRPPRFKTYIIERDPFDQYRSMYEYQVAQGHTPYSPHEFFQFTYEIYVPAGPAVKVLRYENLTAELKDMCRIHGIPWDEQKWKQQKWKSGVSTTTTAQFYEDNPDLAEQVRKEAWHHFEELDYKK